MRFLWGRGRYVRSKGASLLCYCYLLGVVKSTERITQTNQKEMKFVKFFVRGGSLHASVGIKSLHIVLDSSRRPSASSDHQLSINRPSVLLFLLDGMLVHRRLPQHFVRFP